MNFISSSLQREALRSFTGACRGILVVSGVQHVAARVLAELAVPEDVQAGESHSGGDPRHGQ